MEEHQWRDVDIEMLLMDFDMVKESLGSKTLSKGVLTVLDLLIIFDFLFGFYFAAIGGGS